MKESKMIILIMTEEKLLYLDGAEISEQHREEYPHILRDLERRGYVEHSGKVLKIFYKEV